MARKRDPEYDVRDAKFAALCGSCARARNCSFKDDSDGAESVCTHLILDGTYNCESCLRYKVYGGCDLHCCFYTPVSSTVSRGK